MSNSSVYKIIDLSHDGRGVAKHQGKTLFVEGAIPGDEVSVKDFKPNKNYDEAVIKELIKSSADRAVPFCQNFSKCGGCQLQHMQIDAQRKWKTHHFQSALSKTSGGNKVNLEEALTGADKGYRRRVKFFVGKDKTDKIPKVGFRAKSSHDLVDIDSCPMLSSSMNKALQNRRPSLLASASRNIQELMLIETEKGLVWSDDEISHYAYELKGLSFQFPKTGFIQVNAEINQKMVSQALDWLELSSHHKVLDLFCGVGNFTLPIAQQVDQVVGIEGDVDLVQIASENARLNALPNAKFYKANLFESVTGSQWFKQQRYDRVFLDPGRLGAKQVCEKLSQLKPEIIVYVSCNEATLVRDLRILEKQGYQVKKTCFMDMFPHTSHAELMVQLEYSAKLAKKKPKSRIFRM